MKVNGSEENKIEKGGLNVKTGKQALFLNYGDIAGFNVDGDYIICYTMDGKKSLLDQSMDKLEKSLPTSSFFSAQPPNLDSSPDRVWFRKGCEWKTEHSD